jgi:CubicO group peptidase (beta-lactamase class C family)
MAVRNSFDDGAALSMRIALLVGAWWCSTLASAAPTNVFTSVEEHAIRGFLPECIKNTKAAMVVGLVDESGSRVFAAGALGNGTDGRPDGDTVFFIGSVSKTFTALLLLDMVERGEVRLDDHVAKYLPTSVVLPKHGDKAITLFHLATHSAGLPFNADNMSGKDVREEYESYSVEKMYAFLSSYQLSRDPGAEYQYSNVGMALLGHALERRAGVAFESLVKERICQPLGMDSTCTAVTPELKERLAMGHDDAGQASPPFKLDAYAPAGGVHSTANDLLKYAAAQAGLSRSKLTPAIDESHVFRYQDVHGMPGQGASGSMGRTAMSWVDSGAIQPPGMELLGHAGGAGSYHAWVGFDKRQRRGVVVLSTENKCSVAAIGWTILQRLQLTDERKHEFARELIGVGVALELLKGVGALRITKVLPESPAAKAGLTDGLLIVRIGEAGTAGKSLVECVDLIRGPEGTKVRLELMDVDKKEIRTVELTRQKFAT